MGTRGIGRPPASTTRPPIAGKNGYWDGGFLVETLTPDITASTAKMLNNLCLMGTAGSSRLQVKVKHDYHMQKASATQGNGQRRRR